MNIHPLTPTMGHRQLRGGSMEWAKLNVFQRLVRQWDQMHPYNAAQIMRLSCPGEGSRLSEAWHQTLLDLGLGPVRTAGRWYRFESLNGDPCRSIVERHDGSQVTVERIVTTHLNRRFDPDDLPLRPFVLVEPPQSHYMGLFYHHWLADSASIRVLLREWFYRLYDPSRARRKPLQIAKNGYWHFFGPRPGNWKLDEGLLGSLRWSSRMRRVRRVEQHDFDNYQTQFSFHRADDGLIHALLAGARGRGVTLNDVFLAALAQICDLHAPLHRTRRREDLALGTIVDLRSRSSTVMSDVFGLFLGFTSVVCRPNDLLDWEQLLRRVAAQNAAHKRSGVSHASMIRMLAGLVAHRILGPEHVKDFYRKRLPLAGGVSNVNLNGSWVEQYHPHPIQDYIRVSPCGPMMPLVVTPTTLGRSLNFGLTCRESVIPADCAALISTNFHDRLRRFAAGRP